ncbi:hypothetical protein SAMN04489761_3013 [Tenacibaculum sp. MAR_2009_124]|uniref:hypothetical protein n=1 Tax=Tenacibaculum sp. MAR_2009_124 TaxID=1250059 RepID=UPI000894E650|nr:hypothetical protein [Tenacibaculum sp. MAR_2009_124]SEC44583.1 hypothetical protein SAMN04489761_3013 [Tenacibaculum sp. MAR_2009_124]
MEKLRKFVKEIFRTKFIEKDKKEEYQEESKAIIKEDVIKKLDNRLSSIKESRSNYRKYRIRLEVLNEILEEDPSYYSEEEIKSIIN